MNIQRVISPPFLAVAVLLVAAFIGTHGVLWAMDLHILKEPLPLRKGLYLLPKRVGTWEKVGEQQLSHDVTDELGTRQYALWTYQNREAAPGDRGQVMQVLVAYYTDIPDATPHVQAHHYVMGGVTGIDPQQHVVIGPGGTNLNVSTARTGTGGSDPVLVYVYAANGTYVATPGEVQELVTNPSNRYAYWCKLEFMPGRLGAGGTFRGISDAEQAVQAVEPFLNDWLPAVASHLPVWDLEEDQ